MIKFSCEHCGRRVSVRDEHAGKRGKCPRCGRMISVPEKSIVVGFLCENCGEKISALRTGIGKKGKCPKCGLTLVVPAAYDLTFLDMEEIEELKSKQSARPGFVEQADEYVPELEEGSSQEIEIIGERKLPWFVDIFLYPLSVPGLKHLAIFIGVPASITLLQGLVPGQLYTLFWLAGWVVRVLVFLYMYWYFAECIRDSADGWVRAPEGLGAIPDFDDMFWQGVNIIGCLGIVFAPAVLYALIAGKAGLIFWLLSGVSLFIYPMALLAAVMFNSPGAIDPALLFRSISGTFLSYCSLVLLFVVVGGLVVAMMTMSSRSRLVGYMIGAACIYLAMMTAHLSGRFYWRHRKKLNWQV